MEGFVLHNFIKNRLKQRGAALVEYAVLLSFVCAVGWSFVGSNNGMTGSIGSIIHSVERLLGMNGVVNVDDGNWINFDGNGTGQASIANKIFNDGWTWSNIWTDDSGDRYAGSAFLGSEAAPNSKNASLAAKQLIDAMFNEGSFGGVDPVSWAFTEGYEANGCKQSLNLYWSNSDWTKLPTGSQVPIMQMNKEADGDGTVKYYVAMANVGKNGSIALWNEAAALKGDVTYFGPGGKKQDLLSASEGEAPKNYNDVNTPTASNKLDSSLVFDNYNEAQKAYYELVAQHKIKVNNNYSK